MRRRLGIVLQLALVAVVAWLVWRRLAPEIGRLGAGDFVRLRPSAGLLALSTAGLVLLHLMQAFLWRRVVVDVGAPPPDARTTIRVYFVSGLARFIPGSLWQFAGLAVLGQEAGIPALASSAGGVIGNLAFLATGVVFLAFTLPGAPGLAKALLGVVLAAAALASVFLFTATPAGARVRGWAVRHAPAKLVPAVELAGRIRPSHALGWTLGYGCSWIVLAASFAVFVEAFVPGSLAHARELGGVMALSYLGGYVFLFAPAGLGVREAIMATWLVGIVGGPAAIVIPIAQRIWFFVAEAIALASFPLFPRRAGPARRQGGGPDGPGEGKRGERTLLEVL